MLINSGNTTIRFVSPKLLNCSGGGEWIIFPLVLNPQRKAKKKFDRYCHNLTAHIGGKKMKKFKPRLQTKQTFDETYSDTCEKTVVAAIVAMKSPLPGLIAYA